MDAMQGSKESTQRVDLLYLLDSLVQTSQRQNAARSGPSDPLLARLYRDTVSAAVRRVVNCICQDLAGCEKALKVGISLVSAAGSFVQATDSACVRGSGARPVIGLACKHGLSLL